MTLDANIVIAYLAGEETVVHTLTQWREEGMSLFLSTVAEAEVLSFSSWTPEEAKATELFLEEGFVSVPFDRRIARIAAGIRRTAKIKVPDAAIAATAIVMHTPVVTRNIKDFRKVKEGLRILRI